MAFLQRLWIRSGPPSILNSPVGCGPSHSVPPRGNGSRLEPPCAMATWEERFWFDQSLVPQNEGKVKSLGKVALQNEGRVKKHVPPCFFGHVCGEPGLELCLASLELWAQSWQRGVDNDLNSKGSVGRPEKKKETKK